MAQVEELQVTNALEASQAVSEAHVAEARVEEAKVEAIAPQIEEAQAEEAQAGMAHVEAAGEEMQVEAMEQTADGEDKGQAVESNVAGDEAQAAPTAPMLGIEEGSQVEEPQVKAEVPEVSVADEEGQAEVKASTAAVEETAPGGEEHVKEQQAEEAPTAAVEESAPGGEEHVKEQQAEEAAAMEDVKEDLRVEPKAPQAKSGAARRQRGVVKAPPLEVMAAKIKRLREEADEADAAVAAKVQKLQELEAEIAAMRSEAEAKRAAAQRASQEYIRKQCEAAIAELEADVPKRPQNAYFMFSQEHRVKGSRSADQNKKVAEMWANLGDQEKQKYKDRYEAENKRFLEWGNSEEGRKNLQERNELIRRCKAASKEELDSAVVAIEPRQSNVAAHTSPAKRSQRAEETPGGEDCAETPPKQRRVAPVRAAAPPPVPDPIVDEKVLEEAGKADLLAQFRNLAGRPDVLALGRPPQDLLEALKANNGMVNAAKRALLGS